MIYIVIVNYKCWQDTLECLESLLKSTYKNWQAIVVDNNSNDKSLQKINESLIKSEIVNRDEISIIDDASPITNYSSKILMVQSSVNRGFGGANNLVLEQLYSKNDHVWLLNPDMVVEKSTLENLHSCAKSGNREIVWGTTVKSFMNPNKILFEGGGRFLPLTATVKMVSNFEDSKGLNYINGSSLYTSLSNFRKVGLFDERYFLYWEETDWCFRARSYGLNFSVCSQSVCFDKGSTSIGRGFTSDYYYGRNSLIFLNKYFANGYIVSSIFFSFFRIINRFLNGNPLRAKGLLIGIIDFMMGRDGEK